MPYGNPGGYRKRNGQGRGGRGGGNTALVNEVVRAVMQRIGGGGRRGSTTGGRLGKGVRAAARTKAHRSGDNGFTNEAFEEPDYQDMGRGPLRIGHRM